MYVALGITAVFTFVGIIIFNIWVYQNLHIQSIIPLKAVGLIVVNIAQSHFLLGERLVMPKSFFAVAVFLLMMLGYFFYISPAEEKKEADDTELELPLTENASEDLYKHN